MRQLKITKSITNRESEALEKYLSEIGKEELLSADEEVELAQRIRKGDKKALERLTKANLRFVVSVAKQYQNQGLSLPDLINEGNVGLIKAAEKYDETRGFKFISYAVWWIRQSILQAIAEQSRIVRLPLNQVGSVNKINRVLSKFEQEHERRPSIEEIADKVDLPHEKIEDAMKVGNRHVSVDAPFVDGEDNSLLDILVNDDSPMADRSLVLESLREAVPMLDRKLCGYAFPDAVLTGVETRSSSPVRIVRDGSGQSALRGLFPCGEGAGYAGGILSAAVDGIRQAEAVLAVLMKE